jgi:hypothetical protein
MSLYYKQEFTSPGPIVAEVKEQLKSYFNSGIIDDMMFPKWIEHCLRRFRKSSFRIEETILEVCDYQACLPEGFAGAREAWMCSVWKSSPIQAASSLYYQKDCRIGTEDLSSCDPCFLTQEDCDTSYAVTHKVTDTYLFSFRRTFLLTPGNMPSTRCQIGWCANEHASTMYTYDIHNGNIVTNFAEGKIHLIYYAEAEADGEQLIPKNFWVEDFIRKFLVYKCFEQVSNLVTDETFNQVQLKLNKAEQQQAEAFIIAEIELKKQTVNEKFRQIGVDYRRNLKYRQS